MNSFAWLAWAFAVMAVVLVVRNPWVIAEVLLVVLCVRLAWGYSGAPGAGWLLRLSVGFGLVSVVFNALTVRSGNQVLVTVSDRVPGLRGPITMNAIAYGVVSAAAMVALVVAGLTASERVVWADVFRVLPTALEPVAVTTSVAWTFLPQVRHSWQHIREAQAMRGMEIRGVRSFTRVTVPLMGSALERSLVMAEALEARGYGGTTGNRARSNGDLALLIISIAGFVASAIAAINDTWLVAAGCALGGSLVGGVAIHQLGGTQGRRTRYRSMPWSAADRSVIVASVAVVSAMLVTLVTDPGTRTFPAYPELSMPVAPLPLMVSLSVLLLPAWSIPRGSAR